MRSNQLGKQIAAVKFPETDDRCGATTQYYHLPGLALIEKDSQTDSPPLVGCYRHLTSHIRYTNSKYIVDMHHINLSDGNPTCLLNMFNV